MGVYIEDMNMPVRCSDCPLSEFAALSNCKLLKCSTLYDVFTSRRRSDCPLREYKNDAVRIDRKLLEDANFEW